MAGAGLVGLVGATTRQPGSCDQWDWYGERSCQPCGGRMTGLWSFDGQTKARVGLDL